MEFVRLRSGREVAIRPIRADDVGRLEAAHARLSPDSRYGRFLAAKPRLTSEEHKLGKLFPHVDARAAFACRPARPRRLDRDTA